MFPRHDNFLKSTWRRLLPQFLPTFHWQRKKSRARLRREKISPTRRPSAPGVLRSNRFEARAGAEKAVIYFSEVVIFRREPENRDGVRPLAVSSFARRIAVNRFVDAKGGSAEQSHLLSGNDKPQAPF